MAAGDVRVLDNASVSLGGKDVSAYVASCRLHVTNPPVSVPNTFGRAGPLREVSDKYDWMLDIEFVTDGWGATELDGIMTAMLKPPLGSGSGRIACIIKPDGGTTGTTNPSYTGTAILNEWEPLGSSGAINEAVRQTRTFQGAGDLAKATA